MHVGTHTHTHTYFKFWELRCNTGKMYIYHRTKNTTPEPKFLFLTMFSSLLCLELSLLPSLCVMPMDRGLCKANEKRFFYNQTAGRCRPFSYTGCGGNENNFTSRKACVQMCKKGTVASFAACGLEYSLLKYYCKIQSGSVAGTKGLLSELWDFCWSPYSRNFSLLEYVLK